MMIWKSKWHHWELSSAVNCVVWGARSDAQSTQLEGSVLRKPKRGLRTTLVAPCKCSISTRLLTQKKESGAKSKEENVPFYQVIVRRQQMVMTYRYGHKPSLTLLMTCCYTLMQKTWAMLSRWGQGHAKTLKVTHWVLNACWKLVGKAGKCRFRSTNLGLLSHFFKK